MKTLLLIIVLFFIGCQDNSSDGTQQAKNKARENLRQVQKANAEKSTAQKLQTKKDLSGSLERKVNKIANTANQNAVEKKQNTDVNTFGFVPPEGMQYKPTSYFNNIEIEPNRPTFTKGIGIKYTIDPPLPNGLEFDKFKGTISGIPSIPNNNGNNVATQHTVVASNPSGSTQVTITVQITTGAPENLHYNTPVVYFPSVEIFPNTPTVDGGVQNYKIYPELPEALILDSKTGIISGTAANVQQPQDFVITAENPFGNTTANVRIAVSTNPPINLVYSSPVKYFPGQPIEPNVPTVDGAVTEFVIFPDLPQGLVLDSRSGIISGTAPNEVTGVLSFTINAKNPAGSTSAALNLQISGDAPNNLTYDSPVTYFINTAIPPNVPTFNGNVISFTGNLPSGLTLDPGTGAITGTPTELVFPAEDFFITATNNFGSTVARVNMEILSQEPNIVSQPENQTVVEGDSATFVVVATGLAPLTFRWFRGTAQNPGPPVVGATAPTFTINSVSQSDEGNYFVEVRNNVGLAQSDTVALSINQNLPPEIFSINPNAGPGSGGTSVTIQGKNFIIGGTGVTIGGNGAIGVNVINPNELTCITPAGTPGDRDVTVFTNGGSATLKFSFTYSDAPFINQISPITGSKFGLTPMVINGANFVANDTTVRIGGQEVINIVVLNSTELRCSSSPGIVGPQNVVISTSAGNSTVTNGFTYFGEPRIDTINPNVGARSGGTPLTITGQDFTAPLFVNVGGKPASNVNVVNTTTVTCNAPVTNAGVQDVVVTTEGGSDVLVGGITTFNPPTINNISPNQGPSTGGSNITVSGSNFFGAVSVRVGGQFASNVNVINTSQLTCTTPPGTAGSQDVIVTTEEASATLVGGFTYFNAPNIVDVNPDKGPIAGGTPITINGNNFIGNISVLVGNELASNVNVVSINEITCTTPANTAGAKDVTVNAIGGSGTLTGSFTYFAPPTINTVDPNIGPNVGGTSITITGADFFAPVTVKIGLNDVVNLNVVSDTKITCETPAGFSGPQDVTISALGGTTVANGAFTFFDQPIINNVNPNFGPLSGGTSVTINGENFVGAVTVTIDGVAANNIVVPSPFVITCDVPAGTSAGAKDVKVTAVGGEVTFTGGFTYFDVPVVNLIDPDAGPPGGDTAISISGENFFAPLTVTIDGNAVQNLNIVSNNSITCTTPAGTLGAKNVVVTNDEGATQVNDGFRYVGPPTVNNVNPNIGSTFGGDLITVTGTEFFGNVRVRVGNVEASNVTVSNPNTLRCITPAGTGTQNITVIAGGGQDTLVNAFDYKNPPQLVAFNFNVYSDVNKNAIVDAGDTIVVKFNQVIQINDNSADSFVLPVEGDSFGAGATINLESDSRTVTITLGNSPHLKVRQTNLGETTINSASQIDVNSNMSPNAIEDAITGVDAAPNNEQVFDLLFDSVPQLQTFNNINVLDLADIDLDGDLDLLMVPEESDRTLLLKNDGKGVFSVSSQIASNSIPRAAFGDVDSDGDPDLAIENGNSSEILKNDGVGNFTSTGTFSSESLLNQIFSDVDNDGDLDLLVRNSSAAGITVFENDGNGNYSIFSTINNPFFIRSFDVGDIDKDGDVDIIATKQAAAETVSFINDGSGNFSTPNLVLTRRFTFIDLQDIDTDGDLDILGDGLIVFNDGSGKFIQQVGATTGGNPSFGDIDKDGDLDVIYNTDKGIEMFFNNGGVGLNLSFVKQLKSFSGGGNIHIVDVDKDGDLDFVLAIASSFPPPSNIFLSSLSGAVGNFSFVDSGQLLANNNTQTIHLVDVNKDGKLDAIFGNSSPLVDEDENEFEYNQQENRGEGNTVFLNNGTGSFTNTGQSLGNGNTQSIVAGDIDKDGDIDFIAGNSNEFNRIFLNNGSGIFSDAGQDLDNGDTRAVLLADVDKDGDLDLISANNSSANLIFTNDGSGNFSNSGQTLGNNNTFAIAIADIDKDGDLDLITANSNQPNRIFTNDGSGNFSDSGQTLGNNDSHTVVAVDVDKDGDIDLVFGNKDDGNRVFTNDGSGNFTDSNQILGANDTRSLSAVDFDLDGDIDLVAANFGQGNTLWTNDGNGFFSDSGQTAGPLSNSTAVQFADIDRDGDFDIVVANSGINGEGQANEVFLNK